MSGHREDEPVFVRAYGGRGNYVYNHRNPVGLALIIGSLVLAVGIMWNWRASTTWSEGELRDAVRGAARSLDKSAHTVSTYWDYEDRIKDAIEATGEGPEYGLRISKQSGGGGDADLFEITAKDLPGTSHCMTISPGEPTGYQKPGEVKMVMLSVTAKAGSC